MLWVIYNGFLVLSHSQYFLFVSEGAKLTSEGSGCRLRDRGMNGRFTLGLATGTKVLFTRGEA